MKKNCAIWVYVCANLSEGAKTQIFHNGEVLHYSTQGEIATAEMHAKRYI